MSSNSVSFHLPYHAAQLHVTGCCVVYRCDEIASVDDRGAAITPTTRHHCAGCHLHGWMSSPLLKFMTYAPATGLGLMTSRADLYILSQSHLLMLGLDVSFTFILRLELGLDKNYVRRSARVARGARFPLKEGARADTYNRGTR